MLPLKEENQRHVSIILRPGNFIREITYAGRATKIMITVMPTAEQRVPGGSPQIR